MLTKESDCTMTGVMFDWQVFGGGGSGPDTALPDGTSRPEQREHRRLQQQEVLAARRQDEAHEARHQPVSTEHMCIDALLMSTDKDR